MSTPEPWTEERLQVLRVKARLLGFHFIMFRGESRGVARVAVCRWALNEDCWDWFKVAGGVGRGASAWALLNATERTLGCTLRAFTYQFYRDAEIAIS